MKTYKAGDKAWTARLAYGEARVEVVEIAKAGPNTHMLKDAVWSTGFRRRVEVGDLHETEGLAKVWVIREVERKMGALADEIAKHQAVIDRMRTPTEPSSL